MICRSGWIVLNLVGVEKQDTDHNPQLLISARVKTRKNVRSCQSIPKWPSHFG
jgi:hypothetical protein